MDIIMKTNDDYERTSSIHSSFTMAKYTRAFKGLYKRERSKALSLVLLFILIICPM